MLKSVGLRRPLRAAVFCAGQRQFVVLHDGRRPVGCGWTLGLRNTHQRCILATPQL